MSKDGEKIIGMMMSKI